MDKTQQVQRDPGISKVSEGGSMKTRAEGQIARGGVERESTESPRGATEPVNPQPQRASGRIE
jgi:hypothetical protein